MTLIDTRVNPQTVPQGNTSEMAVGQDVSIAMMRKQLDQMNSQGDAAVSLLDQSYVPAPPPSADGRKGTRFSAYA